MARIGLPCPSKTWARTIAGTSSSSCSRVANHAETLPSSVPATKVTAPRIHSTAVTGEAPVGEMLVRRGVVAERPVVDLAPVGPRDQAVDAAEGDGGHALAGAQPQRLAALHPRVVGHRHRDLVVADHRRHRPCPRFVRHVVHVADGATGVVEGDDALLRQRDLEVGQLLVLVARLEGHLGEGHAAVAGPGRDVVSLQRAGRARDRGALQPGQREALRPASVGQLVDLDPRVAADDVQVHLVLVDAEGEEGGRAARAATAAGEGGATGADRRRRGQLDGAHELPLRRRRTAATSRRR